MGKINNEFMMEKIVKEIALMGKGDIKGLHSKSNQKMEGSYWFIPSVNLVEVFNAHVKTLLKDDRSDIINSLYNFTQINNICNRERCSQCRDYCYNWKQYFYKNGISSRFNRLLDYLVNRDELTKKINKQLKKEHIVRIHTEGDFFDMEYLEWWMGIISNNPSVKFYTYTKQFELMSEYKSKHKKFPKNFYCQLSYDNNSKYELPVDLLQLPRFNVYYTYKEGDFIENFYKNNRISKCKGKCSICRQCYTLSKRVILCKLH